MFVWNSRFFDDPADVSNLISGFSAFSKTSLNIWKFAVHVLLNPGLENFEHCFPSMWDECNCAVVWAFLGIAFLRDWNENWPFPVLWPLLSFPNLPAYWVSYNFAFSLLFMGFSRQEWFAWSGLPFPSAVDHILSDLCTMTNHLRWPHTAWLSFIEWDKTVVLCSDWLVFCDYGLSVSALWCPLATPTVPLEFLLPWTWSISSRLLQQSEAAAPYLGWGVSSHAAPPDLERGSRSSPNFCADGF